MAKSVQEKIVETHTLKATGVVDAESMTIETEDEGIVFLQDLMKKVDGKLIAMTCQAKRELDPNEEAEEFEDDSFM